MTYHGQGAVALIDSQRHGPGCELYLVEGESAALSVARARNANTQAVLALQGKPLNAYKANIGKIAQAPLYQQLASALGIASPTACTAAEEQALRFERIMLLFDPDADGIHIGALTLLYFKRCLPQLLDGGRIYMVRAPMYAITLATTDTGEVSKHYAYTPQQAEIIRSQAQMQEQSIIDNAIFRGLGSLPPELLQERCLEPTTRHADAVTKAQMQAVVDVFGGSSI